MWGGKSPLDVEGNSAGRPMGNLKDNHVDTPGHGSYTKQRVGHCCTCPTIPQNNGSTRYVALGTGPFANQVPDSMALPIKDIAPSCS